MNKTRFHTFVISLALMAGTSSAQSSLPTRGPDYFRDAADLARLLGSAHAIRVRCNGKDDQYWRRYMANMLAYEAPEPGPLRSSMVQEFNDAFSRVSEDYETCDGAAVNAEAGFAVAGQRIATRLASHYFPRRASKREGSD